MAADSVYSPIPTVLIQAMLAVAIATAPVMAQDLIAQGRALAEENCARCHAIGSDGESAHPSAPPFRTLSEFYPVTDLGEALAEGIVSGHPDMPVLHFEAGEVEALIAYLQSVQPK
jgi:cytochrome c